MYHIFLAVFVSLVGTGCSLPKALDEALIHAGTSDMDLSAFYKNLRDKDYRKLPEYYAKLEEDRKILKTDIHALQNTEIPESAKALKRLVQILLDQEIFKIQGLMPDQPDVLPTTTKKPKPSTEKPTHTTTKKPHKRGRRTFF